MRRTLTVLALMIALLLPATASAGKRHDHRKGDETTATQGRTYKQRGERPRRGFITLYNPNAAALKVKIDGDRIGPIEPGETVRVGPFDEGEHTVVAKFADRDLGLRQRVFHDVVRVDRRHPARIVLPVVELAVVRVVNDWIEPMRLVVDSQVVGEVPANGGMDLLLPPGSRLALLGPNGEMPMRLRVRATALASVTMALVPPSWPR